MIRGETDMSAAAKVQELNRELARRINQEARTNPQSPYANKLVGIANGQVVVVTDDWDDLAERLRQAEPDPSKTFGLEASRDYDEVHEIWGLN
jgi:pyruvate dehydrogenase complex dehydrogenase (E1) component